MLLPSCDLASAKGKGERRCLQYPGMQNEFHSKGKEEESEDVKPSVDTRLGASLLTSKLTALVEELKKISQKDEEEVKFTQQKFCCYALSFCVC